MSFQSQVFQLAKDADHPGENQDAYAVEPSRGTAVVADGVSSAIFSRQWARILVNATLADTPNPDDPASFGAWLAGLRHAWAEQVDTSDLAWFQRAKLPTGAFSTLLWVQVAPLEEERAGAFGAYRLEGHAIGDSCLFHVRRNELVRSFPIQNADALEDNPVVLGSVDLGRDQLIQFARLDELCYEDDLLILTTDAVAEWILRRYESDRPIDWGVFREMSPSQWRDTIARLRQENQMRYDDATMLLLRVAPEGAGQGDTASSDPAQASPPPDDTPPNDPEASKSSAEAASSAAPSEEGGQEKFKAAGEGIDLDSRQFRQGLRGWSEKMRKRFGKDK